MNFFFGEVTIHDTPIVRAGGELDLAAAPELRERLDALIEHGARLVILDLTETTFIDSTTISAIVAAHNGLRSVGGSLEIVCRNRNVRRIFFYTGLDQELSIRETLEESAAVAHPA